MLDSAKFDKAGLIYLSCSTLMLQLGWWLSQSMLKRISNTDCLS